MENVIRRRIVNRLVIILSLLVVFSCDGNDQKQQNQISKSNNGISYNIKSEETLEQVCRKRMGCSNTVRRIIESNDGFIFETYLTDSTDSVGCTPNPYDKDEIKDTPCSTVGDYGAGRHFMKITNIKTKKTIKIEAPHVVTRVNTLLDNPNIIFRTSTGGASCCTEYLTYSKNTLELISSKNSLE
tara:strand:+ start:462 stop:1016 length:555 start_codon:yes stop_codon:yes gene_type:complete